jgi:hypothetical protein
MSLNVGLYVDFFLNFLIIIHLPIRKSNNSVPVSITTVVLNSSKASKVNRNLKKLTGNNIIITVRS